jgi:hypothetical protein
MGEPTRDHIADGRRDRQPGRAAYPRGEAFEREQSHGLRDEQRVALGFAVQGRGELGRGDLRGGEPDVLGDLVFGQARKRDAARDRLPGDLGEHHGQRLGRYRVDVSHRAEQQHVHRPKLAREELKQQQGGRVGRVQVIEDQHQRPLLRSPPEELGSGMKQPEPGSLRLRRGRLPKPGDQLVQLGKDRRDLGRSRTQLADKPIEILNAQVRAQ